MASFPPRSLFIPLASNAHSLVSGAPIASVRRRLKVGSLLYNAIFIEGGVKDIHAGPTGSFVARRGYEEGDEAEWQTSMARNRERSVNITISLAREDTEALPESSQPQTVINSPTSLHWVATLEPFKRELPAACDWVQFGFPPDPLPEEKTLTKLWSDKDKANGLLYGIYPDQLVRSQIIELANRDLAFAATNQLVLSADKMHSRIVSERIRDDNGWALHGFALPLLVPDIANASWSDIAELRTLSALDYLRHTLDDIEVAAIQVIRAEGGDLERAVRTTFERKLSDAVGRIEGLGSVIKKAAVGFFIGAGSGLATCAITGPIGPIAGAAVGTVVGAAVDGRRVATSRKSRAWVGVMNQIQGTAP